VDFPEAPIPGRSPARGDQRLVPNAAGPKEKLDSTKTSGVTTPFSSASFNDVLRGHHARRRRP